jgi:hypothetical protein
MGTNHKGFGSLQTPSDLLSKLKHDLERMKASPEDTYAAFDYFVTAEHIIDWAYPDESPKRSELRKNERMLEIVSHIANGNKHFQATQSRHKSVEKVTEHGGGLSPGSFDSNSYDPGSFQFSGLTISLNDGSNIYATKLAEKVYEFWRKKII